MLNVEPRALIQKLNTTCTRALESAAGACLSGRHYEVSVEHVLLSLLDTPESDLVALLGHFNLDVVTARNTVERQIADFRSGNPGKPVFSTLLLEWLQDAWLLGSVEWGQPIIRSASLLARLVDSPVKYLSVTWPWLEALPRDQLRRDGIILATKSGEASAGAGAAYDASQPGSAARGDGALARFASDLTERARQGTLDPVYGRERETRQVIEILVRRRKNNPIIIGEAGVGKTALVEGLAHRIVEGSVPDALKTAKVFVLDLGALQAGAGVKGEFENRLKAVLNEIKASTVPAILFIDEAHTLIGAGGSQGTGDAANLLKPALARGELRTIAATTYAEFKKFFEKDAALERRFQPVRVEEPSEDMAILMLRGLAREFEKNHGVFIHDSAVQACVRLSSRYISGRQLPDKAVDLLDTSAAYVKLVRAAPPPPIEDGRANLKAIEREIEALNADSRAGVPGDPAHMAEVIDRKATLEAQVSSLELELEEQRRLVQQLDEARAKAVSDESNSPLIAQALEAWRSIDSERRLVSPDVDASVVEKIVSDWTGIPVGKMVKDDVKNILALDERLGQRVLGQRAALQAVARELRAAQAGLKSPQAPHGVFLLVGPSGVGKTETALALADLLYGGERFLVTINMSEFQERHTVSRLIGSPPGYVGFGEGGVLTEAVRHRPYSLVLLDEVEKADPEVLNIFYQVFDKGMLADGEGRVIDFKNTVVVMTSNLATELITKATVGRSEPPDLDALVEIVRPTLTAHFKPALLARMTVVPYVTIGAEALKTIIELKLQAVADRARRVHGLDLKIDPQVVETIAARCSEVDSGARNVEHVLRKSVLPQLSRSILEAIANNEPLNERHLVVRDGEITIESAPLSPPVPAPQPESETEQAC